MVNALSPSLVRRVSYDLGDMRRRLTAWRVLGRQHDLRACVGVVVAGIIRQDAHRTISV